MNGLTARTLRYSALSFFLATPLAAQEITAAEGARRIEALQGQQCLVQQDVRGLPSVGSVERNRAIAVLRDTKDRMHAELSALQADVDRTAALRVASEALRDTRLAEKILYTQGTIEQWDDGSENTIEAVIQDDLATVRAALLPSAPPRRCGAGPA